MEEGGKGEIPLNIKALRIYECQEEAARIFAGKRRRDSGRAEYRQIGRRILQKMKGIDIVR